MVSLTPGAAERLREIVAEEGSEALGVRLSIQKGGCAGWSYDLSLEADAEAGDQQFESNGVHVFVDEESLPLLDGSEIDYVDTTERTGFTVNNPNVVSSCGCGNSFQAK